MAIQTDDCDIRDTKFWMSHGGNGDFYITLMENKKIATEAGGRFNIEEHLIRLDFRVAMSGGISSQHPKVAKAIVDLFRALEEANLNNHPQDDIINSDNG